MIQDYLFDPSDYKQFEKLYNNISIKGTNHIKYSQGVQELILNNIFSVIGTQNNPPLCVEFGHNNNNYYGTNTGYLIENKKWKGIFFDGNNSNKDINLNKEFLTSQNIVSIFKKYNISKTCDLISIDLDSIDIWILFELLKNNYRPSVYQVEFNIIYTYYNTYLTHPNIINENDSKILCWDKSRIFGSSLQAFNLLANMYGYKLVGVDNHNTNDAFFIRNDLCPKNILSFDNIYNKYIKNIKKDYFKQFHKKDKKRKYRFLLDFETYLKTKNISSSLKRGQQIINHKNLDEIFMI